MVSRYNRRPSVTRRPNVKSDNEDWILERITSLEDTLSGVEDNLNALIEAYNGTRDYLDELEERLVNAMKKIDETFETFDETFETFDENFNKHFKMMHERVLALEYPDGVIEDSEES